MQEKSPRSKRKERSDNHPPQRPWQVVRQALVMGLGAAGLGLVVQTTVHPKPVDLWTSEPIATVVPCPVKSHPEVPETKLSAADIRDPRTLIVDATPEAKTQRLVPQAQRLAYDFLSATPAAAIERLADKALSSGARRIVVVGDGGNPDSGKLLAEELAAFGLRSVAYAKGGAPALTPALR